MSTLWDLGNNTDVGAIVTIKNDGQITIQFKDDGSPNLPMVGRRPMS